MSGKTDFLNLKVFLLISSKKRIQNQVVRVKKFLIRRSSAERGEAPVICSENQFFCGQVLLLGASSSTPTHHIITLSRKSLRVSSQLTLTRPCLRDFEMTQVICHVLVLRKIGKFGLFDLEPGLGSALHCVAALLLRRHVRPADPVLDLGLALQVLQRVAFHLPCDRSWPAILSDPLLPRDAFPQQVEGEEHGGK